jgi:hypothetical protein
MRYIHPCRSAHSPGNEDLWCESSTEEGQAGRGSITKPATLAAGLLVVSAISSSGTRAGGSTNLSALSAGQKIVLSIPGSPGAKGRTVDGSRRMSIGSW